MAFIFTPEHITSIERGIKNRTSRVTKPGEILTEDCRKVLNPNGTIKWMVGRDYAIKPGRTAKGVGRIRILSIRQERLQDITETDVIREGYFSRTHFIIAWSTINTRKGTRWEDNPLVWCIEFEYLQPLDKPERNHHDPLKLKRAPA